MVNLRIAATKKGIGKGFVITDRKGSDVFSQCLASKIVKPPTTTEHKPNKLGCTQRWLYTPPRHPQTQIHQYLNSKSPEFGQTSKVCFLSNGIPGIKMWKVT